MTAEDLIQSLQLKPLPQEGGYFRETYRSALTLPAEILGPGYLKRSRTNGPENPVC